jgi:hypothetical protein
VVRARDAGPDSDWSRILRSGVVREPMSFARDALRQDGVPPSFRRDVAAAWRVATPPAAAAARSAEADPILATRARAGQGVAAVLGWRRAAGAGHRRGEERAGAPPAGRARPAAARLASAEARPRSTAARAKVRPERDPWGAAIASPPAWGGRGPAAGPRARRRRDERVFCKHGGGASGRRRGRVAAEFRRLVPASSRRARGLLAVGWPRSAARRPARQHVFRASPAVGAPGARLFATRDAADRRGAAGEYGRSRRPFTKRLVSQALPAVEPHARLVAVGPWRARRTTSPQRRTARYGGGRGRSTNAPSHTKHRRDGVSGPRS